MTIPDAAQSTLCVHKFDKKVAEGLFLCSTCERAQSFKGLGDYGYRKEFDAQGNITHYKDSSGYEIWWEYGGKEMRFIIEIPGELSGGKSTMKKEMRFIIEIMGT